MHILPFLSTHRDRHATSNKDNGAENKTNKNKIISLIYEGEDRIRCLHTSTFDMCMLADGHGGHDVAQFLADNTCRLFSQIYHSICYKQAPNSSSKFKKYYDKSALSPDTKKFVDTFITENVKQDDKIVKKILKYTIKKIAHLQKSNIQGSTLVGFVRIRDYIITFNVGDSRCYALDIHGQIRLLTRDHNFKMPSERKRLLGQKESKTRIPQRLDGVLAMTRSIGDADVPRAIAKPDIKSIRAAKYTLIALVSDGTYEYINDSKFQRILRDCLSHQNDSNYIEHEFKRASNKSNDDKSHIIYIV